MISFWHAVTFRLPLIPLDFATNIHHCHRFYVLNERAGILIGFYNLFFFSSSIIILKDMYNWRWEGERGKNVIKKWQQQLNENKTHFSTAKRIWWENSFVGCCYFIFRFGRTSLSRFGKTRCLSIYFKFFTVVKFKHTHTNLYKLMMKRLQTPSTLAFVNGLLFWRSFCSVLFASIFSAISSWSILPTDG